MTPGIEKPAQGGPVTLRIDDVRERRGKLVGLVQVFRGDQVVFGRYIKDLTETAALRQAAHDIGLEISADEEFVYEQLLARIDEAEDANDERPGYTMPPPHKYAEAARFMLDKLGEDGRWLLSDTGAGYYFNGVTSTPVNVRSDEMKAVVVMKLGRTEDEPGVKHLLTRIIHQPQLAGEPVTLRHNSWYDAAHNTLYLDMQEGKILKVTADAEPEAIKNGTDGVLFDPEPVGTPWQYIPGAPKLMRQEWINRMSFSKRPEEECPFSVEEQQLFFQLWVLSFWFRSQMRARPLAMAYGETGSGKTTALEQAGQILIGPKFTTNPSPDKDQRRDFETAVVNQRYMVIDNLDYYVPWLEDLLAAVSTGSAIKTRVLFENMKLGYYYPDVFISISTREPKHRRDDIANRSIFFLFEPVPAATKQDANDMYSWLVESRNELLSEMVDMAREVLRTEKPRGKGVSFRMTGFALFAKRAAAAMDRLVESGDMEPPEEFYPWYSEMVDAILEKQEAYQTQYTVEQDPLMLILPLWLEEKDSEGRENWRSFHSTTDMFRRFAAIAERNGIGFPIKNAQSLGSRITSRRSVLESEYVIDGPHRVSAWKGRKGGSYYNIRPTGFDAPPELLS